MKVVVPDKMRLSYSEYTLINTFRCCRAIDELKSCICQDSHTETTNILPQKNQRYSIHIPGYHQITITITDMSFWCPDHHTTPMLKMYKYAVYQSGTICKNKAITERTDQLLIDHSLMGWSLCCMCVQELAVAALVGVLCQLHQLPLFQHR